MLQAFGLAYEPGPLVGFIFQNIELSVNSGEHVALVGPNGAGKTKLLEILAGLVRPQAGRVVMSGSSRIGFLAQDLDDGFEGSLRQWLESGDMDTGALQKWTSRLGLPSKWLDRPFCSLSLGERTRAALARIMSAEPNILLLDEPTNHLDIGGRRWLESFVRHCDAAVLMACHDRAFVNATAERVLLLENGHLTEYAGGYDDMCVAREQERLRQHEEWARDRAEQRRLRKAVERTLQNAASMTKKPTIRTYDPKANAFYAGKEAKLDRRAKALRSRVSHIAERQVEKPFEPDRVSIRFLTKPIRSGFALTVRGLSKGYEGRLLFQDLAMTLESRARLGILGPNGCGKTTLLRLLRGEESPDAGSIEWGKGVEWAYLSQARGILPPNETVLKALISSTAHDEQNVRNLLGQLRLRGDNVLKLVGTLSVGERTKAEIAAMLLSRSNVLILDEPTNHLDIEAMEALEKALAEFPGAVIFSSHDRAFVDKVADEVIEISP